MGFATQADGSYLHNRAQEQLNMKQAQLATNFMLQVARAGQQAAVAREEADRVRQQAAENVLFFQQQQKALEKTELYKAYKEDEEDYMHINGSDRLLKLLFGENAHNQEAIIHMITFEFFSDVLAQYGLEQTKYLRVMVMNYLAQALIKKGFLDAYNIVFAQILQLIDEATLVPVSRKLSQDFYNEIFLPAGLVNTEEGNKKIVEKVEFKSPEIEQHIKGKLEQASQFRKYEVATLLVETYRFKHLYNESSESGLSKEIIVRLGENYYPKILRRCLNSITRELPIDIDMAEILIKKWTVVEKGCKWSQKALFESTFLDDRGINYKDKYEFAAVYQNNPKGGKELGQSIVCGNNNDLESELRQRGFTYKEILLEKMKNIGQYYVNGVIVCDNRFNHFENLPLNPYAPLVFISLQRDQLYYIQRVLPDNDPGLRPINFRWWKLNVLPRIQREYNLCKKRFYDDLILTEDIERKRKDPGRSTQIVNEMVPFLNKNLYLNMGQLYDVVEDMIRLKEDSKLLTASQKQDIKSKMAEIEKVMQVYGNVHT
jgi:hypothetical protein